MIDIYSQFQKKIREVKKKQLKKLDIILGTYTIEKSLSIPEEIFSFIWLEELNLKHNDLTTLPESIGKLKSLTNLNIKENKLTTLPEGISKLTNLTELDFSKNHLTTLPECIRELTNLTVLNVNGNEITTLPEWISELTNLTELNVSNNQLTTLPERIGELTNLTNLNIKENKLTTLPEGISRLANLTELNFSYNPLTTLPECIRELINLTVLNVNGNKITSLPEWISKLTNLNELNVSNSQLTTLPERIGELTNLTVLIVNGNEITSLPEWISKLTNLTKLIINFKGYLTIPESIGELTNLAELDISMSHVSNAWVFRELTNQNSLNVEWRNKTTLPKWISKLKNLTKLSIRKNLFITLPESIGKLTNLTNLNIEENQIACLPESICELANLKELNVSNNQLTILPERIGEISNLTVLKVSGNRITKLPESIGKLTNLTELDISGFQLTTLPEWISKFTNLTILDISNNQLTTLPEWISKLTNLTELDICNNQLTTLPESIGKLQNLKTIMANSNKLTMLPNSICELQNLEILWLNNNKLIMLPESIGKLKYIFDLDLSENNLTILPESIGKLTVFNTLTSSFFDNPLEIPPPEITKHGIEAIISYFRQKEKQGEGRLHEAKIMFVGDATAGKTTMMNKLLNHNYPVPNAHQESTIGIDIKSGEDAYKFKYAKDKSIEFQANLWDFGGQQIQYCIHHFFLSPRSLYILLASESTKISRFDYWLNIINIFGEKSPVLVALNEKNGKAPPEFHYDVYKERYSDLKIEKRDVDLSKNDDRFYNIKNRVEEKLSNLKHLSDKLPKGWVNVRFKLNELQPKKYISVDEYINICDKYSVSGWQDQEILLQYLNDIGVVINFQDNDTIFLNHKWVATAIYSIFANDNKKSTTIANTFIKRGVFTRKDIYAIWGKNYSEGEKSKIFNLMQKNYLDICYKLPQTDEENYLIPLLLSKSIHKIASGWNKKDNISRRLIYKFLPFGLISRINVRLSDNIFENIIWKTGVILKKGENKALINKRNLEVIEINITGNRKTGKSFLNHIMSIFETVHETFKCKPEVLIPCYCDTCFNSENPSYYDSIKLKNLLDNQIFYVKCGEKQISILKLLGEEIGYEVYKQREQFHKNKSFLMTKNLVATINEYQGSYNSSNENDEFCTVDDDYMQIINSNSINEMPPYSFSPFPDIHPEKEKIKFMQRLNFFKERFSVIYKETHYIQIWDLYLIKADYNSNKYTYYKNNSKYTHIVNKRMLKSKKWTYDILVALIQEFRKRIEVENIIDNSLDGSRYYDIFKKYCPKPIFIKFYPKCFGYMKDIFRSKFKTFYKDKNLSCKNVIIKSGSDDGFEWDLDPRNIYIIKNEKIIDIHNNYFMTGSDTP